MMYIHFDFLDINRIFYNLIYFSIGFALLLKADNNALS